jgi:hypothetical protein
VCTTNLLPEMLDDESKCLSTIPECKPVVAGAVKIAVIGAFGENIIRNDGRFGGGAERRTAMKADAFGNRPLIEWLQIWNGTGQEQRAEQRLALWLDIC